MKQKKHFIFYISDGTGITAETMGSTLLSQFDNLNYEVIPLPYVDTIDKAILAAEMINSKYNECNFKPIVFSTLVENKTREAIKNSNCYFFDFLNIFLNKLSEIFNEQFTDNIGRSHRVSSSTTYNNKMKSIDFTIQTDDGMSIDRYDDADIIILGPSRTGKTPTSLYLALQYGMRCANFPIIYEEFNNSHELELLLKFKDKLFGLTISSDRLHEIRSKRFKNSNYSSLEQCNKEISRIKNIYIQYNIPYLDTTSHSVEEIATKILNTKQLRRKIF